MSELNKLAYFLNCIKDILPFENEEDFKKQIRENKDFRIKVQKLVYLSKFFGWDNSYNFTLAERGPYSVELKHDYSNFDLFKCIPEKIEGLKESALLKLSENKDILFFEAASTILYTLGHNIVNLGEEECVTLIQSIKQHIPSNIIKDAYYNILKFNLYQNTFSISKENVENLEFELLFKIKNFTDHFEEYEGSRNKIIVLGSIDYMRITIRESHLNLLDKYELLMFIKRYIEIIGRISEFDCDELIDLNLDSLEELFDQFQDYVSEELKIIKRIDDDFDETLCY